MWRTCGGPWGRTSGRTVSRQTRTPSRPTSSTFPNSTSSIESPRSRSCSPAMPWIDPPPEDPSQGFHRVPMQLRQPCDVLAIGGGGAALRAVIAAKEVVSDVVVCCKGEAGRSGSTMYAGCSMIAALPTDPPQAVQSHFKGTLVVGEVLTDGGVVWG